MSDTIPVCPRGTCQSQRIRRSADITLNLTEDYSQGRLSHQQRSNPVVLLGWRYECRLCGHRWHSGEGMTLDDIQIFVEALVRSGA